MSADVLREAAALMRSRAENSAEAIVGPLTWTSQWSDSERTDSMTALHYQSWKPPVTLAVADWLDYIAEARTSIDGIAAARSRNGGQRLVPIDSASRVFRDMERHAIAVAHAYLGTATRAPT